MDYLRSCYSTKMHFKSGDSRESDVTWYFAPDDAEVFPERHNFGSLNWSPKPRPTNAVGEIQGASRPWSNGETPDGIVGTNHCGTDSEFRGITAFRTTDMPLNAYGQPDCCDEPPPAACVPYVDDLSMPLECEDWTSDDPHSTDSTRFLQWDTPGSPSPATGFVWEKLLTLECSPGVNGSMLSSYSGITVYPGIPLDYDPDTGVSTWMVSLVSPYLPGTIVVIGPPPAPGVCVPWLFTGTPLLTAGGFSSAAPDFGDWFSGEFWWLDPMEDAAGFHWTWNLDEICEGTNGSILQTFDFDVSGSFFDGEADTYDSGTQTSTWTTASDSPYRPSTSATIVVS